MTPGASLPLSLDDFDRKGPPDFRLNGDPHHGG